MNEKHLTIGTGIDQAAQGNISISLDSTGYTQEQLFKAVEAAKDVIKKELDPNK